MKKTNTRTSYRRFTSPTQYALESIKEAASDGLPHTTEDFEEYAKTFAPYEKEVTRNHLTRAMHQAYAKGIIRKVSRGVYELDPNYVPEACDKSRSASSLQKRLEAAKVILMKPVPLSSMLEGEEKNCRSNLQIRPGNL